MWRWVKRVSLVVCALVVLVACAGATYQWLSTRRDLEGMPPPGRLVDVGGHRLHIWCTGAGSPTVILESGLGGSSVDWGFVQPDVATFTRVCSYDRAGMGYSDAGPLPRTARRIAAELALLLDRSRVDGPLVLVGASFGGFIIRLFASEHSNSVAGLVLVDASHENQTWEVPRIAPFVPMLSFVGAFRVLGISFGPQPAWLAPAVRAFSRATRFRTAGYRTAASELLNADQSAAEVKAARRELTVPLVVVTAGRSIDTNWQRLQRDQTSLSGQGCQIIAAQSGHAVALDDPQVVADAIRAVVDTVRERHEGPLCH